MRPLRGGGEEQRRQQLLRRRVPEIGVSEAPGRPVSPREASQCGDPHRAAPAPPLREAASPAGLQPADLRGVKDHHLAEFAARRSSVSPSRSALTDVASTGPCHSRRAGIASPVVLWVWVGPKTITDWRRRGGEQPARRRALGSGGRLGRADAKRGEVAAARPARGGRPARAGPEQRHFHPRVA